MVKLHFVGSKPCFSLSLSLTAVGRVGAEGVYMAVWAGQSERELLPRGNKPRRTPVGTPVWPFKCAIFIVRVRIYTTGTDMVVPLVQADPYLVIKEAVLRSGPYKINIVIDWTDCTHLVISWI